MPAQPDADRELCLNRTFFISRELKEGIDARLMQLRIDKSKYYRKLIAEDLKNAGILTPDDANYYQV